MSTYQPIIQTLKADDDFQVDVLRLDKINEKISGNKWFKLKNNLARAKNESFSGIFTFGGAFSNHIASVAEACKQLDIPCIGIIRGEENSALNETLVSAKESGMKLHFVSRENYRKKSEPEFIQELKSLFGNFYLIPEGGSNKEGIEGCLEIVDPQWKYDYVFCACGTGATYAGLMMTAGNSMIVGISVLKGKNTLPSEVLYKVEQFFSKKNYEIKGNEELAGDVIRNNCISNNYCFGGYACFNSELVNFKNEFEKKFKIPLDYIYTNKLFYAVFDLIKKNKLKQKSKVLIIHSGGLQGNASFEKRYHLNPIR